MSGIYEIQDKLDFGKYKDERVEEVIVDDPKYIAWCIDEVEGFELDEEAVQLLEACLRSER